MKIVEIFKKYIRRKETKCEIIEIVIRELKIPEQEKKLYLDSLYFLDDSELDAFYLRLSQLLGEIESENAKQTFLRAKNYYTQVQKGETKEKEEDALGNSLFFNSW